MKTLLRGLGALGFLFGWALPAAAQDAASAIDTGDTAWVLASAALVLFMTPGLALFYGGMVRRKNVLGTMLHSYIAMALVSVLWVLIGYSLAFAPGNALVGGLAHLGLRGVGPDEVSGTIPALVFCLYQAMFAVITPALISGAIAERIRFTAYLWFIGLWSLIVYCPLAHCVWGGGWMGPGGLNALDFAGGNVVHVSSGVSALVACLMLGKRTDQADDIPAPHNLTLTVLGAGILWFGWFGFNAGSALGANGTAALAFINTNTSAAAATLAWLVVERYKHGQPTVLGAVSGAVAGLVGITPAAGFVTPIGAIFIGLGAGTVCYVAVNLKAKLGYDDSLDAFGVHGVGGAFGAIATGLFCTLAVNAGGANGLFYGDPMQAVRQLVSVLATAAYAAVMTFIILKVVGLLTPLRLDLEGEVVGLDLELHGEMGYRL